MTEHVSAQSVRDAGAGSALSLRLVGHTNVLIIVLSEPPGRGGEAPRIPRVVLLTVYIPGESTQRQQLGGRISCRPRP